MTEVTVTTGAKVVQRSSQIITTNKHTYSFYRPNALPATQRTSSEQMKGKSITLHGLTHLQLT